MSSELVNIENRQLIHLVYFPRSGSTFLASMLETHPDISVSVESGFLKYLSLLKPDQLFDADFIIEDMRKSDRGFANLIKDNSCLDYCRDFIKKNINYYDVANAILSCHFGETDKSKAWVVKSLRCGRHIPLIANKMPQVKFLHIYRDGRATLNSLLKTNKVYGSGAMAEEPLTWSIHWGRWMRFVSQLSSNSSIQICHVQYEKLVQDPQKELDRIFDFIGVKRSRFGENNLSDYRSRIPALEASLHPNVGKEPLLDRQYMWQSELPESHVRLFEMINGKILQEKGYPLFCRTCFHEKVSLVMVRLFLSSSLKIISRKINKIFK